MGDGARSGRDWNAIAAVIAALIGLLALCVSAYTAHVQREQARAQVWTRVYFARSDVDRVFMLVNKGVGPALIQSVRLFVDGKAQADWNRLYAALGLTPPEKDFVSSTINGVVLAPGERIDFLKLFHQDDWQALRGRLDRIALRFCYCSVMGDCMTFDERAPRGQRSVESDRCTRDESAEFAE